MIKKNCLTITLITLFSVALFVWPSNIFAISQKGHLSLAKKVKFSAKKEKSKHFDDGTGLAMSTITITFDRPVDYVEATGIKSRKIAKELIIRYSLQRVFFDFSNNVCKLPPVNSSTIKSVKVKNKKFFSIALIDNPKEKHQCPDWNAIWFDLVEKNGKLIKFMTTGGVVLD